MDKNSTLFTPASDEVSVKVKSKIAGERQYPKADTIRRICQFARVAFSDSAIPGMSAIVLN